MRTTGLLVLGLLLGSLDRHSHAQERDGWPPLCRSAWAGDLEGARAHIAAGADLESEFQRQTPLMWAAKMGHPEIVAALLDAGAEPDRELGDGWTALRWAALAGKDESVRLLLLAGADPGIGADSWYGTLAHLAARERNPVSIELIHGAGAALDLHSEKLGGTPLHVAAFAGHTAVVRALVERGVRIEARGELARTPLHLAAYGGHADTVRELLEHGADREAVDGLGRTAAHLACEEGHAHVLEVLRWDGARDDWSPSLTLADAQGWTPHHVAAAFGHARCLELLQSSRYWWNARGLAPIELALAAHHLDCVEVLLRAAGADVSIHPLDALRARVPHRIALRLGMEQSPAVREELDPADLLAADPGPPSIAVVQLPGYSSRPVSGVQLAVWADGLVLFAPDRAQPGVELRVGRVPPALVERVLEHCAQLGLFALPDWSQVGMHASATQVLLRQGDVRRSLTWDGEIESHRWDLGAQERTYENAWGPMWLALESLLTADAVPLEELVPGGELRGHRPGRIRDHPWFR